MPRNWEALANAPDCIYQTDDFKRAMYQIVCQQCLYLRNQTQAVSYRLISEFRTEISEALDLMGLKLRFNDEREFCCVIQSVARYQAMTLHETLFLLVLRQAYHLRASVGDLNTYGDAIYSIPELEELYAEMTGRDLNAKGAPSLRDALKATQQHGIAREEKSPEDDPQPYVIAILPGIAEILDENAVNRFGANLKASLVGLDMESDDEEASAQEGIEP